jgi:hypothetical protein
MIENLGEFSVALRPCCGSVLNAGPTISLPLGYVELRRVLYPIAVSLTLANHALLAVVEERVVFRRLLVIIHVCNKRCYSYINRLNMCS